MANNVWSIKNDLEVSYFDTSWVAIQADSYQVDIDRGISVEQGVFARPKVGTLTARLVKKDLSDLVTGPAYKSNMPIRIRYRRYPDTFPAQWTTIFYGFISNITMNFNVESQKLNIEINADDATKILTGTRLSSFAITGTTSARGFRTIMGNLGSAITAIDSRVTLSQAPTASAASSSVQSAQTFGETNSGDILNQLLDAELGWCWTNRSSADAYYLTRGDVAALKAGTWYGTLVVSNVHSTATTHICMDFIDLNWNTDNLVNSVKVIESSSTPASDKTVKNTTSITNYGEWPADFEITMDPGASPYTRVSDWATTVANAADPKTISRVSCPAIRRDGTSSDLATIDIGEQLKIEFTDPNNTSNTISQIALISGITHSITPDHWEITVDIWKGM